METTVETRGASPVRVDPRRCTGCGRCVVVCPHRILAPDAHGRPAVEAGGMAFCLWCGHCVAACAADALQHRDLDPGGFTSRLPSPEPEVALGWLRSRRSVRAYASRPVSRDDLRALLEAARYAPTGHNARDLGCVAVVSRGRRERLRDGIVRFYRRLSWALRHPVGRAVLGAAVGWSRVAELREALPGLQRAEERLRRGEDPLFHHAPAILLFHAPDTETAESDCAVAASHVTLLAPSLGLGTCYIGYAAAALRRRPALAARFGVPPGQRVRTVLTAGYSEAVFPRSVPRPTVSVRFL